MRVLGFDDQGRQFDSDGNLVDWWEEETKAAYLEKALCIIEQYGNYTEPEVELSLNGINTQGENIAVRFLLNLKLLINKNFFCRTTVESKKRIWHTTNG